MNKKMLTRFGAVGLVTLSLGLGACSDDEPSIYETLQRDSRFSTLVSALDAAGLDDELATGTNNPVTLFAPTNAAFDALPDGVLDAVLADPDLLTSVLLYHVVPGGYASTDLVDGQTIATLLTGASVTVSISGGTVQIDDASVTQADLGASNGVIHVVNGVLVPETASLSAIAAEVERWRRSPGPGGQSGDVPQSTLND